MFVDDTTDTYITTHLEDAGQGDDLIATPSPVMVFHVAAMHLIDTATRIYGHHGVHHAVVERHEH